MAIKDKVGAVWAFSSRIATKCRTAFIRKSDASNKRELNLRSFGWLAVFSTTLFIGFVLLLPTEEEVVFSEKSKPASPTNDSQIKPTDRQTASAQNLWGSPNGNMRGLGGGGSQINYNTSMIVGSKSGNSKVQVNPGARLSLRIIDKFVVSQEAVPILAELITDSVTESGLTLAAGTRFYGEASFQRGGDRASIQFKQISLMTGQIRKVSSIAIGKDGQPGVAGHVFSDGMKNTAGEVLTTFVGGLAGGSIQTDVFGQSNGGLTNGLLTAVSEAAKGRAKVYGEKLKTEREWIEVSAGTECDALISESINLQEGGEQ